MANISLSNFSPTHLSLAFLPLLLKRETTICYQLPVCLSGLCLWGSYTYKVCVSPAILSYVNLIIRIVKEHRRIERKSLPPWQSDLHTQERKLYNHNCREFKLLALNVKNKSMGLFGWFDNYPSGKMKYFEIQTYSFLLLSLLLSSQSGIC